MKYGKYCLALQGGVVLSCDNILVEYKLDGKSEQQFLNLISSRLLWQYDYFERRGGIGKFKYSFTFDFGQESTVTALIGLFSSSGVSPVVRLDYNPNKIDCPELSEMILFLRLNARHSRIVRWDMAVDFSFPRRDFILVRTDNRKRGFEELSADNYTEYLGRRNNPGRYKLYNKTIESQLDYALTRSELTCSGDWSAADCVSHLPIIFRYEPFSDDGVKEFTPPWLSAFAGMLIRHPEEAYLLDWYDWKQKKNLRNILAQCSAGSSSCHVVVTAEAVGALLDSLRSDILS